MDLTQPIEIARVRQPLKAKTLNALTEALEIQHPGELIFMRSSPDEAWIVYYLDEKEAAQ